MRVLVAEDNEASRNLLVKILQAHGHEVTATANGAEALQQALKEPPDILVTDILMPQMDGYQLCHEWRQHDKLKDIPFIFYTATYTSDEDEKFALGLGASTFIRKPAEPDALVQIINEVFEKAKSGLLAPPKVAPLKPSLYLTEYNKRLVAKLNKKVADLEEAEGKLRHANSVLRAIRGINQLIVREKDRAKILQGACEILIEVREYKFAWIGLIEEGHKRVLPAAKVGVEEDYLNSLRITWDDSETGKGPTGTAIKTRQPFIMNNIPGEPRYKPWREEALKWGYVSWVAIPLVHDEKVYGALNVYSSLEEGFDDEEVQLLAEVSGDIAFALKAIEIEEERARLTYNLSERIKELRCFYNLSVAVEESRSLDELLNKVVELIPEAMQYPELARSRITLRDDKYQSKDFTESKYSISADIKVAGKVMGNLGIYYSKEAPFLKEEVDLGRGLAERIGGIAERTGIGEQLEHSFINLAETVSRAMESRDPYTSGHQRRVAELACLVGEKMGWDEDRLKGLHIGGLLHDIGKISTPESILAKPGRLSDEERSLVCTHAKQGYEILKDTKLPWPVAEMALHHHERVDGSGYPDGISGDKISLENRILGVCDVVEAMSSFRPYRPAKGMAEVLKELRSCRGTKYDADVVDVMLELIESGEFELEGK